MVDSGQPSRRHATKTYANRPELKDLRRDLRHHATPAERRLWSILKGSQLAGRKFRRQHSVDRFVLDFYCPSETLAIELDGSVHDDPLRQQYDADRSRTLASRGIRVLRFENREVFETPDLVADAIASHFGHK